MAKRLLMRDWVIVGVLPGLPVGHLWEAGTHHRCRPQKIGPLPPGEVRDQGQSPQTETGKGPIYRLRGLTEAAVPETIYRSQSVPTLVKETSRTHAELAVARHQPASKQGHEEWMPLSQPRH